MILEWIENILGIGDLQEELREIISQVDADDTGENGEEYLLPEAKEAGFETNYDYFFDKEAKETDNMVDLIKRVVRDCAEGFEYVDIEVLEDEPCGFIIAISVEYRL